MTTSPEASTKGEPATQEEPTSIVAEGDCDGGEHSDSSLYDGELRPATTIPKRNKSNKKKQPSSHHSLSSHRYHSSSDEEGLDGSAASLFDDSAEPGAMEFKSPKPAATSAARVDATPRRASGRLGDRISVFESKNTSRDDDMGSSTWHAGESLTPSTSTPLQPAQKKKNKIATPAAFLSPTGSRPTPSQQRHHHRGSSLDNNTWHADNKPPKPPSSSPPKGATPGASAGTTVAAPATPKQKKKTNRVVTPSIFMSPPAKSTQRRTSEQKALQGLSATPLRQSWHGKSSSTPKRNMADFKPEIQTNILGFHDRRKGFDGASPSLFMTPSRQSRIITSGEKAKAELQHLNLLEEDGHATHQIVEKKVHEYNELVEQSHQEKQDQRERYRNTTSSFKRQKRTNNRKLPRKLIEKKKQKKDANGESLKDSSTEKKEKKPQNIRPTRQDDVWTNVCARPGVDKDDVQPPPIFDLSDDQKKIIEAVIEDNFLLDDLLTKRTSDAKDEFVQAFEPLKYEKKGEVVVECDVSSDDYYIVQKGQVNFTDGQTKDILGTAKEGMSFGQLNLLYSAMTDTAVVTAEEGTSLLKVSQTTFRHIMKKTAPPEPEKTFDQGKSSNTGATTDVEDDAEISVSDEATHEGSETDKHTNNATSTQRQNVREYVESNIRFQDLEKLSMLGEGQFGEVWLVAAKITVPNEDSKDDTSATIIQKKFALKSQYKEDEIRGSDAEDAIRREMELMSQLQDNAFIAELVNTYEDDECIYALMGLLPGGELWDLIHREDPDTGDWINGFGDTGEETAKFYSLIVADTLAFMHNKKILYRDLKPENVMLDQHGYPVIVDFGFSKQLDATNGNTCFTFCGTPNYVCPEIIQNSGHSYGADHWALGVLVYEMTVGENPWYSDGMDQMELYHSICNDPPYAFPEDSKFSKKLWDLIERIFEKNPKKRLGMVGPKLSSNDILQHEWFAGLDLIKLRTKELPAPHLPEPSREDETEIEEVNRQEEAFLSLVNKQCEHEASGANAAIETAAKSADEDTVEGNEKPRLSLQSVREDAEDASSRPFNLEDIVKAKEVGDPNTRLSLNVRSWSGNQKGKNIRQSRENKRDSRNRRSNIKSTLFSELGDLSDDDMD